jgi:hypothetical protein
MPEIPQIYEYIATYMNGFLLVEVPLYQRHRIHKIQKYMANNGIVVSTRVHYIMPGFTTISPVASDMLDSAQRIGAVGASTLDDLVVLVKGVIKKDEKIRAGMIDGRIDARTHIGKWDCDPILFENWSGQNMFTDN